MTVTGSRFLDLFANTIIKGGQCFAIIYLVWSVSRKKSKPDPDLDLFVNDDRLIHL